MVRILLMTIITVTSVISNTICSNIPYNFYKYRKIVDREINRIIPTIPKTYFYGLIEHESCVSLRSKRCWNPKSRLKTKREEGAGLLQITRVFRRDGSIRWDMLRNLKLRYRKELKGLNWNNIYRKLDLQTRAGLLLWKGSYDYYKNKVSNKEIMWFADSAYNGGFKYLNRERTRCKFTKGCNPKIWFNNVEKMKSRRALKKLYGNRTAWDINRHHVRDVKKRKEKYENCIGR